MPWFQRRVTLAARPRGFHLITEEVVRALPELATIEIGLLHVFLLHTSASLTISENADPDVPRDLESSFDAIVPESFPWTHTVEGPDDMPAHVKNALLGCSLTIPVSGGRPVLGTWQGIFLCEHRNHGGRRRLVITLHGEPVRERKAIMNSVEFGGCRLQLVKGNITSEKVDAIVNAANEALAGGGGVDGAIHDAAGPTLMEETHRLFPDGCRTGGAVPTSAGTLQAKYVFHAVGPVWRGGQQGEAGLLASCYRTCLELAVERECESIAFPAISTGAYGYPLDLAADRSLREVVDFLQKNQKPALVRIVLFDDGAYSAFQQALEPIVAGRP